MNILLLQSMAGCDGTLEQRYHFQGNGIKIEYFDTEPNVYSNGTILYNDWGVLEINTLDELLSFIKSLNCNVSISEVNTPLNSVQRQCQLQLLIGIEIN